MGTVTVKKLPTWSEVKEYVQTYVEDNSITSHTNLSDVSTGDHHSRYADDEAVDAVESAGKLSLSDLDLDSGDQGIYIHDSTGNFNIKSGISDGSDTAVAGAGGSEIQLNESGRIVLKVDESTGEGGSVDTDVGIDIDNGQISFTGGIAGIEHSDLANANASSHHSKYTDTNAKQAVEGGRIDRIQFSNTEFTSGYHSNEEAELAWDNSEGLKLYWNGSWRQVYSEGPTDSDISPDSNANAHHSRPSSTDVSGEQSRQSVSFGSLNLDTRDDDAITSAKSIPAYSDVLTFEVDDMYVAYDGEGPLYIHVQSDQKSEFLGDIPVSRIKSNHVVYKLPIPMRGWQNDAAVRIDAFNCEAGLSEIEISRSSQPPHQHSI